MRHLYTIFLLLATLSVSAQKILSFKEVLNNATEISITDSILINYFSLEKTSLDKTTGQNFFLIIHRVDNNSLKETEYFSAGKITSHKDFDILLLCSENSNATGSSNDGAKLPIDRSSIKELFFVLLDKEGNYKNNYLAAMDYEIINYLQKTTLRKISSWIYKDLRIVQHIEAKPKPNDLIVTSSVDQETRTRKFSMEYHINDYGVFVAYPNGVIATYSYHY